jgi:hypothetical protein
MFAFPVNVNGHVHGFTDDRLLITDYLHFSDRIYKIYRIMHAPLNPFIIPLEYF